ncbi:MAG: dolichyl-phosphate-mannose--protein mannosyltransferase [Micrococcales bacterium]
MFVTLTQRLLDERFRAIFDRWSTWLIVALAAALRFYNLGYPHSLVFDETYYVKDAISLTATGYEHAWPTGTDEGFAAGNAPSFIGENSFVVHPPLGKYLIGLGIKLFGVNDSFGWRFATALLGTLTVLLVILIGKRLFRSNYWAAAAGFFMAIDGLAIVMSRTALLDGILAFFVALATYFVVRDRDGLEASLWRRPWLIAAGMAFGAATAVKWSGVYFLAFFGVYLVISDALRERAATREIAFELGAKVNTFSWLSQIKQALAKFVLLVPTAFIVYLATWSGWLATAGGYDRTWADDPANRWTGLLAWVPTSLQSLWHYHVDAYGFHVGLRSPHSYASSPLIWLLQVRPVSFFYVGASTGEKGCVADGGCSSAITALSNVVLWWGALAAIITLAVVYLKRRDRVAGLILLGVGAGYLPWMLYLQRTVFQFYIVAFEPFMMLALAYVMAILWRQTDPDARPAALRAFAWFGGVAVAFTAFFTTIWFGTWVPYWYWLAHMWLGSWI